MPHLLTLTAWLLILLDGSMGALAPGSPSYLPLRWGFVGCGRITHDFAAVIASLPETDHAAVAFASRNASRAQDYSEKFGCPIQGHKAYSSYEELAKDPKVDIVYIGTINPTHYEIAKMLMNHNKHILCEKPMTLLLSQAEELFQIAREKKLFFQEALLTRFFPVYHRIRELTPTLGEIREIQAFMGQARNYSLRLVKKELGGGALEDLGIYPIQFALAVLGSDMPDQITAGAQLNNEGVDTSTSIQLKWNDGRMAQLGVSILANAVPESVGHIFANDATLTLPKMIDRPESFELIRKNKDSENTTKEKYELPKIEYGMLYEKGEGMAYEANEVLRCMRNGLLESPYMTQQESLIILKIKDQIQKQIGVSYEDLYSSNGKFVGSSLHPENQPVKM